MPIFRYVLVVGPVLAGLLVLASAWLEPGRQDASTLLGISEAHAGILPASAGDRDDPALLLARLKARPFDR